MASCVGRFARLYVLAVLIFELTLGNHKSFEVKAFEISELVEDLEKIPLDYRLARHDIMKRAAGSVLPSPVPTNIVSINSSKPTSTAVTLPVRISSSYLKQPVSSAVANTNVASIKPSSTRTNPLKLSESVITTNFPSMSLPTTGKPTTKNKSTRKKETAQSETPGLPTQRPSPNFEDHHKYYSSQYYGNGKQWWFDLENGSTKPKFHNELSTNTKFSDLFKTSFIFPYYGHLIQNVTITNKGYIFLGEKLHKFNASAQYAAPLMANFGAELHPKTSIRYIDTGDRLTVEWANMILKNEAKDKEFSFQCSILKNGTLIFAYKKIPMAVSEIKRTGFFVRVGVSDTFRRERVEHGNFLIGGRRYTSVRYIYYYVYDRVSLQKDKVVDDSAFVLVPEPNCVMFNSCNSCLNTRTKFDCSWCPKINRCSDGIDRHRMEWESAGCVQDSVTSCSSESSTLSGGIIAVIVIILLAVVLFIGWIVYAYYHPQSKSGLFLLSYGNPTKWCRNSDSKNTSTDGGRISFKTMSFESNA